MNFKRFNYYSTLIVALLAVLAGWWLWNSYMLSPWTRNGKIRAEQILISSEVSGTINHILVKDNQFVTKGELLFSLDKKPFEIDLANKRAELKKAETSLRKANHEAVRRRNLPQNTISVEALDEAEIAEQAAQAAYQAALSNVDMAEWSLSKTDIYAPNNGYLTNMQLRIGNYAKESTPLIALIDSNSFYAMGYFEETKLRNIKVGAPAAITLYSNGQVLHGTVESISRAVYDQSLDSTNANSNNLLMTVKTNVPWVRQAQRVPIRIALTDIPNDIELIAGTTCTISIQP